MRTVCYSENPNMAKLVKIRTRKLENCGRTTTVSLQWIWTAKASFCLFSNRDLLGSVKSPEMNNSLLFFSSKNQSWTFESIFPPSGLSGNLRLSKYSLKSAMNKSFSIGNSLKIWYVSERISLIFWNFFLSKFVSGFNNIELDFFPI